MGANLTAGVVSVLLAIIGVAVVATIVSNNAQTSNVIKAGGGAFSGSLLCALSPVIGGGNCGTTSSSTITFN
jgi:predicted acyltransferase